MQGQMADWSWSWHGGKAWSADVETEGAVTTNTALAHVRVESVLTGRDTREADGSIPPSPPFMSGYVV